jgi:hypothetical protein
MFSRPMLLIGVLAAAVVVPYVLFNQNLSTTTSTQWNQLLGKGEPGKADEASWFDPNNPIATPTNFPSASEPVPLEQVFRFDFSPRTVTDLWPRVSTVLGGSDLMGLRVALITGTQPDDVAGSLTYYFDDHHQVQRITLQGTTGDERRLVHLLTTRFGLQPAPTTRAGLYTLDGPAGIQSSLQVIHLPVVRTTAPNNRVEIAVDLQRAAIRTVVTTPPSGSANASGQPNNAGSASSSWYRLNRPLKSW